MDRALLASATTAIKFVTQSRALLRVKGSTITRDNSKREYFAWDNR